MTRNDKTALIEELTEKIRSYDYFYITDSSAMTVAQSNKLRRACFEKGLEFKVIKNSLIKKAFQNIDDRDYSAILPALKGTSALIFSEQSNVPAKLLKEFRESNDKPTLKAAYIDTDVFFGDDQIDALVTLKSKNELLGDVLGLLQSPMSNLLGALQSGGNTLGGLFKALEERA